MKRYNGYQCEKCKTIYMSKEEALTCEAMHTSVKKIEAVRFKSFVMLPDKVDIAFKNDEVARYELVQILGRNIQMDDAERGDSE